MYSNIVLVLYIVMIYWAIFQVIANGIKKKAVELKPAILLWMTILIYVVLYLGLGEHVYDVIMLLFITLREVEGINDMLIAIIIASIFSLFSSIIYVMNTNSFEATIHGYNIMETKDVITKRLRYNHTIRIEDMEFGYRISAGDISIRLLSADITTTTMIVNGLNFRSSEIQEIFELIEYDVPDEYKFNHIKYLIMAISLILVLFIPYL